MMDKIAYGVQFNEGEWHALGCDLGFELSERQKTFLKAHVSRALSDALKTLADPEYDWSMWNPGPNDVEVPR